MEQKVSQLLLEYKGPIIILSFNSKTLEWFRLNAPQLLRGQNLPLEAWRPLSFFGILREALKHCKRSKPHVIVYNALHLPPSLVRVLTWFKPLIAYNVTSHEIASSLKRSVTNIIFENFEPDILF